MLSNMFDKPTLPHIYVAAGKVDVLGLRDVPQHILLTARRAFSMVDASAPLRTSMITSWHRTITAAWAPGYSVGSAISANIESNSVEVSSVDCRQAGKVSLAASRTFRCQ